MPSTKVLKGIANVFLILLITLVMLFIMEGALRLVFGKPESKQLKFSPFAFNPVYQVAMKPNNTNVFTRSKENGSDAITLETNSLGFRGPELQSQPEYRIMVYGDSNILARFSEQSNTYVSQLQSYLQKNNPGKQIETINAGIAGAGTDQAVLRMQFELPIIKPDMVVLQLFAANDMGDMVRNRLYELDANGNLVKTGFPVTIDPRMKYKNWVVRSVEGSQLYNAATKINDLLTGQNNKNNPVKLMAGLAKACESEYQVYANRQTKQFSHFDDHYDIDAATEPQGKSAIAKQKLMTAVLGEAKRICEQNNVKLMVLIEPAAFDLCQNHLFGPKDLKAYKNYRSDNLTNALESACQANQLTALNLYPRFSAADPARLYFKVNDDHWNDAGQKLAAMLTADYIFQNHLLDPSPMQQVKP